MKTLLIFVSLFITFHIYAQSPRLEKSEYQDRIYFSVSRETNIHYYVIEGANDSTNYEIIGKVASKGNTVLPRTYVFDNTAERFKNYRIKQVDYSGVCVSRQYIYSVKTEYLSEEKPLREISKR